MQILEKLFRTPALHHLIEQQPCHRVTIFFFFLFQIVTRAPIIMRFVVILQHASCVEKYILTKSANYGIVTIKNITLLNATYGLYFGREVWYIRMPYRINYMPITLD
jgi:hypothetical protein